MTELSLAKSLPPRACFGVISLYERERPWEDSLHLRRMYQGMHDRAEALGYRLEPIWLRAPGMTFRRARAILEARGIEGLLCFGSPDFDAEFPAELEPFAIVTQGLSIKTPLHRVISDGYNDTWNALERIHALGYRRPGLALGRYEDVRNRHANASAYLGWCEQRLGATVMPILRFETLEGAPLGPWLRQHRPDVMIFDEHYAMIPPFRATLARLGVRVPEDLAIVAISQILRDSGFAGMEENQQLMGAWAVELLVGRIVNRDFGRPAQARIEMVESRWIDGPSLPARPALAG
jgi:DNA-binding LacI/PurR family transcriptional regulator